MNVPAYLSEKGLPFHGKECLHFDKQGSYPESLHFHRT